LLYLWVVKTIDMRKRCLLLLFPLQLFAQAWPGSSWTSATNLTAAMDADGITDLSGLHFNPVNNRLYGVQGDGRLRVLLWNTTTNSFTQIANKAISGGPEGITQANLNANEFYTIDENNYEIRRYSHTNNFGTVTLLRSWNLLDSPSPMEDTGNTGPEGIVFVPDSALSNIGFISSETNQPYTSVKGAGGLFFIAHQDGGYVWVFDVNPNMDDDFAYVGKYRTNRNESCDLAFDRSTGLLYILHNPTTINRLEVTDLSTTIVEGERKFNITREYTITNPGDGNVNIEGFALTPKCPETGTKAAWLCRDVESNEDESILTDALRWFNPFTAAGDCGTLETVGFTVAEAISVYPNPTNDHIKITGITNASVRISNQLGQTVLEQSDVKSNPTIDVSNFQQGIYTLEVYANGSISRMKWIKN
jgi:hypothetical protein